jgi:hypothetical protein
MKLRLQEIRRTSLLGPLMFPIPLATEKAHAALYPFAVGDLAASCSLPAFDMNQ